MRETGRHTKQADACISPDVDEAGTVHQCSADTGTALWGAQSSGLKGDLKCFGIRTRFRVGTAMCLF